MRRPNADLYSSLPPCLSIVGVMSSIAQLFAQAANCFESMEAATNKLAHDRAQLWAILLALRQAVATDAKDVKSNVIPLARSASAAAPAAVFKFADDYEADSTDEDEGGEEQAPKQKCGVKQKSDGALCKNPVTFKCTKKGAGTEYTCGKHKVKGWAAQEL